MVICVECGRAENLDTIGNGIYCIECLQNPVNYARFIGVGIPQYYADDAAKRLDAETHYRLVKIVPPKPPEPIPNPQHKTGKWPWRLFK